MSAEESTNFNSTKVQFGDLATTTKHYNHCYFNSTKVQFGEENAS